MKKEFKVTFYFFNGLTMEVETTEFIEKSVDYTTAIAEAMNEFLDSFDFDKDTDKIIDIDVVENV